MADISIAFLGPKGTYSDEAAQLFAQRLGGSAQFLECPSINTIFEQVDRARCDYGVVPLENSLEGAVTATLDNFAFNSSACILGREVLPIHHNLVVGPDTDKANITSIASHPQGLAQCRRYINEHFPNATLITTASTAESVQKALTEPTMAGIANGYAAHLYQARILEEEIEDHFGNETSFALIARQGSASVFTGEHYKTSLALFMKEDRPGTLLMILSEFAFAGLNLTMIQSRPTKQGLGDYMFFVDIDGRETDADVQTALNCLRLKLREVKILGSYPV